MSSHATSQDSRSSQDAQRRKRKERAAKNRAPEPKDIVSGAGQPLDVSVRRELEEQLGHDFSQVRLHTDRDADTLTDMLGADAVAVGQDIFFREGAYRPGTTDGQRLLAHELLHTVQNPHGLGALRAGRDLGAVSLPQQAMEREAESAAQAAVSDAVRGSLEEESAATDVEPGQSTPGWLRYATVDADRHRAELLDPATLVDRLANSIVHSLRGDPEDKSKRTRVQLGRLSEELLDSVLERLEERLLGPEYDQVHDLLDEVEHRDDDPEAGRDNDERSLAAPEVEIDLTAHLRYQQETERRSAEGDQEEKQNSARNEDRPAPDDATDSDAEPADQPPQLPDTPASESGDQAATPERAASSTEQASSTRGTSSENGQESKLGKGPDGQAEQSSQGAGDAGEETSATRESQGSGAQEGPASPTEEESAAANRPEADSSSGADRQAQAETDAENRRKQERSEKSPETPTDAQLLSAHSSLEGKRDQDLEELKDQQASKSSLGPSSKSEVDVGGGEPSAWDVKLQPEDFLPEQDLDVSGVPTAEDMKPGAAPADLPSFPAPPETKADKVHALREAEDAEAAEQRAAAERETTGGPSAPVRPSEETEGSGPSTDDRPNEGDLEPSTTAPGAGVPSKDPKSGADPKSGPVEAETTVQEAAGKPGADSQVEEKAAKEEKGTPAAGDQAASGKEDAPQQSAGGQATPQKPEADQEEAGGPTTSETEEPSTGSASETSKQGSPSAGESGSSAPDGGGQGSSGAQNENDAAAQTPEPKNKRTPTPQSPTTSAPSRPSTQNTSKIAPAPKGDPAPKQAAEPSPEPAAPAAPAGKGAPGGRGGGGAPAAGGRQAAAAKKKKSAPTPNLSHVPPEAGLATASQLEPHRALQAMGGVSSSVDRDVGEKHQALASSPPSMERPAGAPQTLHGQPKTDAPAQYSEEAPEKSETPEKEDAKVKGAKKPEGEIAAAEAEEPGGWDTFKMALGFGLGKLANLVGIEVDASELAAKFAGLPTKDEALKQAKVGNAPGVGMKGDAEQKSGEQGEAVDAKGEETATTARDDAGRSMGEDQVYPDAPKEQLTSKVPGQQKGAKGGGASTGAGTGAVPPEAASKVAEHDRGPQIQSAFGDGSRGMSEARKTKDRDTRSSKQKHKQQVDAEISKNSKSQSGERDKAMNEVTAQRETWRKEQDQEIKKLGTKKSERQEKVRKDVKDREKQTDKDVEKEKTNGDDKIEKETAKAERDAEKKRDDSVEESGNWVTKAFEWIKQKVIEIKNAIVRVIKAARDAVVGFIENFKETVEGWIEAARTFIVETIKNLIEDLIEFAKAMVQAIIDLANRIRKFITDLIAAAIALVNKLATMLKKIITELLNAIAKLLSEILSVLKKMLMDVVKAVVDAVKTALQYASQLLGALGDFMMIAVDFLSDPGGWLSGAKNSAVDGAKNHLFREVKNAVKEWFQSKIQEILGIPKAIITKLINGGFTLEKIVKETWAAVVPQLPFIIGELVLTKVVAKLIPGAGWVMAVIDALKTAIGALSEILKAIGAVITWLKAVRSGGAGILFAKALAAGVVALLELAYEFLLSGIGKYVGKVGRRLRNVAKNLGKGKKDKPGGEKDGGADGSDPKNNNKGKGDKESSKKDEERDREKPGTTHGAPTTAKPGATPPGTSRPVPKPDSKTDPDKPAAPSQDKTAPGKQDPPGQSKDRDKGKETDPAKPKDDTSTTRPKDQATTPDPSPPKNNDSTSRPDNTSKSDTTNTKDKDGADTSRPRGDRDRDKPGDRDQSTDKTDPDGRKDSDTPTRPDRDTDNQRDRDDSSDRRRRTDRDKDDSPSNDRKDKGDRDDTPRPDKHEESKQEKKQKRKEEESSEESKAARLRKIVARIRPKLARLLNAGVRGRVLRSVLAAMKAWNRLTRLTATGADHFSIDAVLNPSERVILGATVEIGGVKVETNRILRAIRRIGIEIFEQGGMDVGERGGVENFEEDLPLRGGDLRPSIAGGPGTKGGSTQYLLRMRKNLNARKGDKVRETTHSGTSLDAQRNKGSGWNPGRANRVVQVQFPDDPQPVSLGYAELPGKLAAMRRTHGDVAVNQVIANTLRFARGRRPVGTHLELSWQLYVWLIQQEAHRNIGGLTTHAMVLDMLNRKKMTPETASGERWHEDAVDPEPADRRLPDRADSAYEGNWAMQPKGSENRARNLPLYLDDALPSRADMPKRWENLPELNRLAAREIRTIRLWVESLSDFKVSSNTAQTEEDRLILEIRRRMLAIYGISASDDRSFLDSLLEELKLDDQGRYGGRG